MSAKCMAKKRAFDPCIGGAGFKLTYKYKKSSQLRLLEESVSDLESFRENSVTN